MACLKVIITADGARREFYGNGPAAQVVAAFRVWLCSDECALPMAVEAEELDQQAATIATPTLAPSVTVRRGVEHVELVPVWSGALERAGNAPGLTRVTNGASSLARNV